MSGIPSLVGVEYRLSTPQDQQRLRGVDYTMLSALNTCPTWGILRYMLGKKLPETKRAMALELGAAMHEAFAAVRLVQLAWQGKKEHALHHAQRLFKDDDRVANVREMLTEGDYNGAFQDLAVEVGMYALHSSGFEDDPWDKRRTLSNAEVALLHYVDWWPYDRHHVWTRSQNPTDLIGIENIVDIVITYKFHFGSMRKCDEFLTRLQEHQHHAQVFRAVRDYTILVDVRYIGRVDGLHVYPNQGLMLHENKTGARLTEQWEQSFEMSHQPTGYSAAMSLLTGEDVSSGRILGLQIPLPTNVIDGIHDVPITRTHDSVTQWLIWVWYSMELYWRYGIDPIDAPKFTHSCNRYFRTCSMLPFCVADRDEQRVILSEMEHDEWSPLAQGNQGVEE